MIAGSTTELELLVHTTAPSLARHDVFYRSLASAYLDFTPGKRTCLEDEDDEAMADADAESQLLRELHNSQEKGQQAIQEGASHMFSNGSESYTTETQVSPVMRKTYLTRSKVATSSASVIGFSQASFTSLLDGVDSPRFKARGSLKPAVSEDSGDDRGEIEDVEGKRNPSDQMSAMVSDSQVQEQSFRSPASEVEDSASQWYRPIPAWSSSSIVMESFLSHFEHSSPSPMRHIAQGLTPLPQIQSGRRQPDSSSSPLSSAHSTILPDSQPIFHEPEEIEIARSPTPVPIRIDEAPSTTFTSTAPPPTIQVPVSASPPSASHPMPDTPSRNLRKRKDAPTAPPQSRAKSPRLSSSSSISRIPDTPIPSRAPAAVPKRSLSRPASTLTIHPPPPATSNATVTTFLTPALSAIATEIGYSRYRPVTQTRALHALERGYWAVELRDGCGGWDEEGRERTWGFLRGWVGRGKAGWGVWCVREVVGEDGEGKGGEAWRVYCWGEVVREVYLLLYLASKRKVSGMGMRWVDCEDKAVVVMGLREGN